MPYISQKGLIYVDDFILDTGSTTSHITSFDSLEYKGKFCLSKIKVEDSTNKKSVYKRYFIRKLSADSVTVNNALWVYIPGSVLLDALEIKGIIGMDVISRRNWLIDNENKVIHITARKDNKAIDPSYILSLQYKRRKRPEVTLKIGDKIVDNVLLDTGYMGVFQFHAKHVENLKIFDQHNIIESKDTKKYLGVNTELENRELQKEYLLRSMTINDSLSLKNISVDKSYSYETPLIGNAFFMLFSKIFIDTKEKMIYFYL